MPATSMRVPLTGKAQRLPEYQGPGQIVEAQTSARLDDSAAGIALKGSAERAAQAANNGPWKDIMRLSDAVQGTANHYIKMWDRYSQYKAQDAYNQYQEEMMVKRADLERLEGANAIGANGGQSVKQQLEDYGREARERLAKDLGGRSLEFFDAFATGEDRKNYAWAVGKERKEWDVYQRTVDLGTITTAYNQAMNDDSQLGQSMGTIKATVEQMGRREGWSPDFTKSQIEAEEQKLFGGVVQEKLANKDLDGAAQFMRSFGSRVSPAIRKQYQSAFNQTVMAEIQARCAEGDTEGAEMVRQKYLANFSTGGNGYAGMSREGLGSLSAKYESGKDGHAAVGYDKNGGTSYGKYQMSSTKRSFQKYLERLESSGEEGRQIVERLRACGNPNTGSRHGAYPEQWKKEQAEHGELMGRIEQEFIEEKFYKPCIEKLSPELRKMVQDNGVLQDVVWSTAVQHGDSGGADILNKVFRPGMTAEQLSDAVYDERGNHFPSSTPEVRAAVQKRFVEEKQMARQALGAQASGAQAQTQGADVPQQEGASGKTDGIGAYTTENVRAYNMIQAAIKKRDHERKQEAQLTMKDVDDELTYAMQNGKFEHAENTYKRLVDGGYTEEADKVRTAIDIRKQAYSYMQTNTNLPLAEQIETAKKYFSGKRTPENISMVKDIDQMESIVMKALNANMEAFRKDPAGYVATDPARAALLNQEGMSLQVKMRRSLEIQNKYGAGIPGFKPSLLSAADRDKFRNDYDSKPTAPAKVEWLKGMEKEMGPYFQSALQEMKMPEPLVSIAPILDGLPQSDAALFLQAATLKPEDVPHFTDQKKADAIKDVEASKLGKALIDTFQAHPINDSVRNTVKSMLATLTTAKMMNMDINAFSDNYNITTSDRCFLFIPSKLGIDASRAADYLNSQRDVIKKTLLDNPPDLANTWMGKATNDHARLARDYAERIKLNFDKAVWMMTGEDEALLIDPATDQPYGYADGSPVSINLKDVNREPSVDMRVRPKDDVNIGLGQGGAW